MANIVDSLIATRILYLLVLPFKQWPAYKAGIIDENGNILKKTTTDDWTMLHRLVCRLKLLLAKIPGGQSVIGSLIAAYALVIEQLNTGIEFSDDILLENYLYQYDLITENDIKKFEPLLEMLLEDMGTSVGAGVAAGVSPNQNGEIEPIVKKSFKKIIRRNGDKQVLS